MPGQRKASIYTCQDMVKRATEFLEHQLSAAANVDMWLHLASCSDCRMYMEQLVLVRDSLHQLPLLKMADNTRKKLLQRLARRVRDSNDSA